MRTFLLIWVLLSGQKLLALDPTPESEARRSAWHISTALVSLIEKTDTSDFPAMTAWLKDYKSVLDKVGDGTEVRPFPAIDSDRLVTKNPHWWAAYYEVAPGDPLILGLHCSLILAGGKPDKAVHLAAISMQRPGIPDLADQVLRMVIQESNRLSDRAANLVQNGIVLHDKSDFDGALEKYDSAMELCPEYGLAYYEKAFSIRCRALVKSGKALPANGTATINSEERLDDKTERLLVKHYAEARSCNPFLLQAYQGSDQKVLSILKPLYGKLVPAWDIVRGDVTKLHPDEVIRDLAEGCDTVGIADYALVARQVVIARRKMYAAADHPIISRNLRLLVSGKMIERVIKTLEGEVAEGLMFIKPDGDNMPLQPK